MAMDLRTSLPAAAVALGCVLVVTVKTAVAPDPPPRRVATSEERIELAEAVAGMERDWTTETTQNFPADNWSQRDDFHGREYQKVQELVSEKGIRTEDVLRAIDDDIHRRRAKTPDAADDRHARAVPCKPRPFYD
jgi:hypothetical protein